jgi:phosphatidylinositol glycan class P protein
MEELYSKRLLSLWKKVGRWSSLGSGERLAIAEKGRRQQLFTSLMDSFNSSFEDKQPFPLLADGPGSPDDPQESYDESVISPGYEEIEVEDDADFQSHYSLEHQSFSDSDSDESSENIGRHHPFRQSSSSLHGPNAFAPPFYNRPPTPLPPSPSLTSLLRPPFSTTTSRPTTPDSSDVETPNDTEAAVAKSARRATTVPRASPKVPTYEYYGFVLYLASSLAFRKSDGYHTS